VKHSPPARASEEVRPEDVDRPDPRAFCLQLIMADGRVFVETVMGAWVDMRLTGLAMLDQCSLERWPALSPGCPVRRNGSAAGGQPVGCQPRKARLGQTARLILAARAVRGQDPWRSCGLENLLRKKSQHEPARGKITAASSCGLSPLRHTRHPICGSLKIPLSETCRHALSFADTTGDNPRF